MANFATALKQEISRIARREVRGETTALKKAATTYRAEIARLKRRAQALEQQVRRLTKANGKAPREGDQEAPSGKSRFSAKGLASQRKRLGLSASDVGLLVGASAQSIYNWEQGKARPLARHLPAIAAFRGIGQEGSCGATGGSAGPGRGCVVAGRSLTFHGRSQREEDGSVVFCCRQ
jgi:DNA-binding transcriptional regulator YiaG